MTNTPTLDDQIAALLRAGSTQQAIEQQLHISGRRVRRVRTEREIPMPPGPGRNKRSPDEVAAAVARAVEMLRAGITYRTVRAETRLSFNRITTLRREHHIPLPPPHARGRRHRTLEEAYALYAQPEPDGHVIWTGPRAGRALMLLADGRRYNARAVAFRKHHGRDPQGRLSRIGQTCTDNRCIAGAHHADALIRTGATP